jgi:hypothetical protein
MADEPEVYEITPPVYTNQVAKSYTVDALKAAIAADAAYVAPKPAPKGEFTPATLPADLIGHDPEPEE